MKHRILSYIIISIAFFCMPFIVCSAETINIDTIVNKLNETGFLNSINSNGYNIKVTNDTSLLYIIFHDELSGNDVFRLSYDNDNVYYNNSLTPTKEEAAFSDACKDKLLEAIFSVLNITPSTLENLSYDINGIEEVYHDGTGYKYLYSFKITRNDEILKKLSKTEGTNIPTDFNNAQVNTNETEEKENPNTGDNIKIGFIILSMCLGLAGLLFANSKRIFN